MPEKKTQDMLGREANMAILKKERKANNAWNKLKRNRSAVIGFIIVCVMIFLAVFAPVLAPVSYTHLDADKNAPEKERTDITICLGIEELAEWLFGYRKPEHLPEETDWIRPLKGVFLDESV